MTIRRADSTANAARIVDEHRQLAGRLRDLAQVKDPARIAALASELHDLLAGHFVREEAADGLRAAVLRTSPHLVDRLEGIIGEHVSLLAATVALRELAGADGASAEDVRAASGALIEKLRDHEARESSLLSTALWDDVGGEG